MAVIVIFVIIGPVPSNLLKCTSLAITITGRGFMCLITKFKRDF